MGKIFLRFLKYTTMTLLTILVLLIVLIFLFLKFSPEFGAAPDQDSQARYQQLPYYSNGKFSNLIPTNMDMGTGKAIRMLPEFFKNDPTRKPDFEIPIEKRDSLELSHPEATRLVWFGHSAFLLQIDGKNILIDPMLGDVPAPNPLLGKKRFSKELPIEIEKLPKIDLILISHDHYDHLDYGSIQKLMGKTDRFLVPLGVGAHFEHWGVDKSAIQEFAWWEETQIDSLHLAFTPSRHFSGRGLGDRFSTLWGSWVIQASEENIYFSGDSGYGPHFREIGEKFGPFDFAMLECGQYNENWTDIHMAPEETAQAAVDLDAKVFMPIHWAAFTLAMHSWTDPVERVIKKSKELNAPVFVPKIGELIELSSELKTQETWWVKP
ncbi:MBL fold metallo-hydrolase [Algoriphagus jejuensis]|uniref:MBL fold metallo-hydrolase n=1 Tax=Algoriphagus jejuensis TaxID=419934 RepID=A0ABN1MV00_9BACT